MEQSDVIAAVKARFEALWPHSEVTLPRVWPNTRVELPTPPFVSIETRFGAAYIAGLGGANNNVQRQSGEVLIRLFEGSTKGEELVRGYADEAAAIFRFWISGELRFYTAAAQDVGDIDGNLYEVTTVCSFEFDMTA